jgi:RecA/RadA recombinase
MSFIKTLASAVKHEYTNVLDEGNGTGEYSGYHDTGSYSLNALISGSIHGGMPNNKVLTLAGESSTGKTFFTIAICKLFLDTNPTGIIIYFDTESNINKQMFLDRGIDPKRVLLSEPDTIQSFRTVAIGILDRYLETPNKDRPPMLFVLDSLGQLSTNKELTDTAAGSDTRDMTKAQLIKATFRTIRLKLGKAGVAMICTNHVYEKIGAYVPTKEMSGGSGTKYTSDLILFLSKAQDKDGTEVVGNIVTAMTFKSRMTRERQKVQVRIRFDSGLDRYYGLVDMALDCGIFKKEGKKIRVSDQICVFEKLILNNPEKYFTKDVLEKIDQYAQEHFRYGGEIDLDATEDMGDDDELTIVE